MAEESSDAVPLDPVPVVEPAELSGIAAAEPAPEIKAVKPKRAYNRKPKEPKDPKPEPVPEPAAPRASSAAGSAAASAGGALDPHFFAGLNLTLRKMMAEERKTKLSSLNIV